MMSQNPFSLYAAFPTPLRIPKGLALKAMQDGNQREGASPPQTPTHIC